jgi:hypothetical protein
MEHEVRIIAGPPADKISKEAAESALTRDPRFPKNASVEIDKVEGRWVAAVVVPKTATDEIKKESAPPFGGPEEAPSPDGPPAPDGPPTDDGASADSSDGEDKPADEGDKKDKPGEEGKKGLEAQIEHLTQMLTTIVDALGLSQGPDSPVPGEDEVPHAPHGPSPDGPPTDQEGKTHTVHERSMKPGESPPGSTPVGAPAFASVSDDHPWKGILGEKKTFVVEEEIGDETLASVREELEELRKGTGYEIKQLREGSVDGRRTAKALLQLAS